MPTGLVVAGLLAGPALAVLHETGELSIGPSGTLWPIGVIVSGTMLGAAAGVSLWRRRRRLSATLVLLPNVVLLALYGFLLAFFGLGGSR